MEIKTVEVKIQTDIGEIKLVVDLSNPEHVNFLAEGTIACDYDANLKILNELKPVVEVLKGHARGICKNFPDIVSEIPF